MQVVVGFSGGVVGRGVGGGPDRGAVVGDHHLQAAAAQLPQRQAVAEQLVVGDRQTVQEQGAARRVGAKAVAPDHMDERFVERDPGTDAVAEPVGRDSGVLREAVRRVAVQPASLVLEGLREVPVEEGRDRFDAAGQQAVDQAVVEVQALDVGLAPAGGLDARPGDGEAVAGEARLGHQVEVLLVPVVVITGHLAGVPVADRARAGSEGVPDRWSAAVLPGGALDLVRRRRRAPDEVRGQMVQCHAQPPQT